MFYQFIHYKQENPNKWSVMTLKEVIQPRKHDGQKNSKLKK